MINTRGPCHQQTLCWDCANATGGCSWADHHEHKPVEGWKAIETMIRIHNPSREETRTESYIVLECPEFIRDAEGFGARRIGEVRTNRHYKDIDDEAIITAFQSGVRVSEIMEVTGYAESTIRLVLKKAGFGPKKKISTSAGWAEAARRRTP